jgi:RNA polymerase primary sigma factor
LKKPNCLIVAEESPKVAEIDLDSEEVAEGATEEEDEVEAGPDPEIAKQRFTELS